MSDWLFRRKLTSSHKYSTVAMESGGSFGESGQSQIVCGMNYEPLEPFHVEECPLINHTHVSFLCYLDYKIIRAYFDLSTTSVKIYNVESFGHVRGSYVGVNAEKLETLQFHKTKKLLAKTYAKDDYKNLAIQAAVKKAQHFMCKKIYYMAKGE